MVNQPTGMLFALAIGLTVSMGERSIFALALSRPLNMSDEVDSILMNIVLVTIPFFALAFRSSSHLISWVIAFALTALNHGWWLSKGIAYQRAPDGSGVDMSGALMMLVSPFPIALIAVSLDSALRRHANRRRSSAP